MGDDHLCVVTTAGEVKCLGNNNYNKCGGPAASYATPRTVPGITGATQVSAAPRYSCAVASGRVWCWGGAGVDTLGGTPSSTGAVVQVANLTTAVEVRTSPNSHTCARLMNGSLWCWGENNYEQLGVPYTTTASTATPVQSLGVSAATSLAVGYNYTCVVDGGALRCWGYVYDTMARTWQLGSVTGVQSVGPTRYGGGCIVMAGGQPRCWGENFAGQVGDGSTTTRLSLVNVASLSSVTSISNGSALACAVTPAGVAWCWGSNASGALGDGTTMGRLTPVEVLRP